MKKATKSIKRSNPKSSISKKQSKPKPAVRKAMAERGSKAKDESPFRGGLEKLVEEFKNLFSSKPMDLVSAIKKDHEGLRNFLSVLKDTDREMTERKRAYELFSDLLKSHSRVEEQLAYKTADELPGYDMHIKVAEGFVEHQIADDLMVKIERTTDPIEWSAHTNVLSEIVKHHLDEEEREVLPRFRKNFPADLDEKLLERYLQLRAESQQHITDKSAGVLG